MDDEQYLPLKSSLRRVLVTFSTTPFWQMYKDAMIEMGTKRPFVIGYGPKLNAVKFYFRKYPFVNPSEGNICIEDIHDLENTLEALEEYISTTCIRSLDQTCEDHPASFQVQTLDLSDDWNFRQRMGISTLTFVRDNHRENTLLLCKQVDENVDRSSKSFSCKIFDQLKALLRPTKGRCSQRI
jgi:hypothetical protein